MIRIIVISSDFKLKSSIAEELKKNPKFDVISTVFNVTQAANLFSSNRPNALVIDLENQHTTAIFIKSLTEKYKLAVYIIGSHPGIAYIKAGLNNVISKPIPGNSFSMKSFCSGLEKRILSLTKLYEQPGISTASGGFSNFDYQNAVPATQKIVAIAASTGGTEALPVVLQKLPATSPPILIVQHMPSMFTKQFAERLDKLCSVTVKEAMNGEYLKKGVALVAPGDLHMRLVKRNQKLAVECFMAEKMHGVRPAADILFNSIVANIGGNVIGAILTGMGGDGARGLYELHIKGATVIAQNKDTCVVYGMPKVTVELGAADYVLPLDRIADKIVSLY